MNHWEVWESWGADPWVVEVLRFSYRIPFRVIPSLSLVLIPLPSYSPNSVRGIALDAVVADLRVKGAVEPAPSGPGYYSRLFVTPKVTGGWKPVIDLSLLNRSRFHMETVSSSGRLDGVSGSPGCLPSGSSASVISALPEVLCGGLGPAVLWSLFRPVDFPAGVHAGHGPCVCHHAPVQFQDPTLPGRLACPRILVSEYSAGEGLSPLALPGARSSGDSLQELSGSVSDFGLSGDEASNTSFEGFPDPKACPEALLSASRLRVLSLAAADFVVTTSGCDVVPVFHRTRVSAADALPSAAPQHRRPSPSRFRFGVLGRFLPRGSSVVV